MYKMPAEYQPHRATLMIWPVRPGSWGKDPARHRPAFVRVFEAITQGEDLYLLAGPGHLEEARAATAHLDPARVHLLCIDSDDAWARDVGPTFVQDEAGRLKGISWRFNAWGGEVDGLYADWQKDDAVASAFCDAAGYPWRTPHPLFWRGAASTPTGKGRRWSPRAVCSRPGATRPCPGRRSRQSSAAVWASAKCCGCHAASTTTRPTNTWTTSAPLWGPPKWCWPGPTTHPTHSTRFRRRTLPTCKASPTPRGRRLKIHKLPIPDHPVLCSEADCDAYEFAPGEDTREPGERLAASYVNFYFVNGAVLVPQLAARMLPATHAPAPSCRRCARTAV